MYESGASPVAKVIAIAFFLLLGFLFIKSSGCSISGATEVEITNPQGVSAHFF